jgi:hypothetical protein
LNRLVTALGRFIVIERAPVSFRFTPTSRYSHG